MPEADVSCLLWFLVKLELDASELIFVLKPEQVEHTVYKRLEFLQSWFSLLFPNLRYPLPPP